MVSPCRPAPPQEAADQKGRSPINLVPTLLVGVVRQVVASVIPGVEKPLDNFEDFNDVLALFKKVRHRPAMRLTGDRLWMLR